MGRRNLWGQSTTPIVQEKGDAQRGRSLSADAVKSVSRSVTAKNGNEGLVRS
jgi:hypothetical protein